ncbi:MAG: glycosyltransferase family 2 protein [Chloroflexaceae bacterium]|nr:glycosyltransferase family 2 protein [Chloroflexaceae bacterium]
MSTLSIAIIARDEERHIGACLESIAGVADEVVIVLDARSRDRTEALGQTYGARLFIEPWQSYPAQRNRALERCRSDWVLFVDADERLTPELRHELRTIKAEADQPGNRQNIGGYWIPRYNQFFGQVLRGGGWYPDRQLRLVWRTRTRYDEDQLVHEVAGHEGAAGTLNGHLLHINIECLGEFWQKQTNYALAEARMLARAGRRTRWRNFVGSPLREFWRRYVRLGGWRDGPLGFFLCASLAWFEVVKYSFLLLLALP